MPRKIPLRKRLASQQKKMNKKNVVLKKVKKSSLGKKNLACKRVVLVSCEKCGKAFRPRGLGPHRQHCNGKEGDVKCDKCGKLFRPRGLGPHRVHCKGNLYKKKVVKKRKRNKDTSSEEEEEEESTSEEDTSSSEEDETSTEEEEEEEEEENEKEEEELPDVLVRVRSRKRWKTSVPELVALCSEAQRQRTLRQKPGARTFKAPISVRFVEDTIELMQPLFGWMLHNSLSGDLRGFLLCTTFTTWVGAENLRWVERKHRNLARRLNDTPRQGAPLTTGVIWPRIAEVSLVGGLGCGSSLMHELLRRLKSGKIVSGLDHEPYEYV
jgi:hypothetical protein